MGIFVQFMRAPPSVSFLISRKWLAKLFSTSELRTIDYESMKKTANDVVDSIDAISRNEYLFVRACERFFSYHESHEILLSSPDEMKEMVYYVPILKTLQSLTKSTINHSSPRQHRTATVSCSNGR
jgi:hypothetical protein